MNLWPDDVHSPFFPPRDRRGDGSKRALYLGVLEAMDEQLGVLFDHVRASERLRNNTLILVMSDNGPEPGAGTAGPFRGTKGMLYEGGVRSPLIVWGPGMMRRPAIGSVDRTVGRRGDGSGAVAAAGSPDAAPAPGAGLDGVPALDVLLGKTRERRAEADLLPPPARSRPHRRATTICPTWRCATGDGSCSASTTAPSRSSTT